MWTKAMSVAQQLTDGRIRQRLLTTIEMRHGLEELQRIYSQLLSRAISSGCYTELLYGSHVAELAEIEADWLGRETIIRLQGELYAEMRKGE